MTTTAHVHAFAQAAARSEPEPVPELTPLRNHSSLSHLSDADLLANTRRLVGRSNQLLAALLAHLAAVEARGLHRHRACSSLYIYCIYELRFSEDEAYRRVNAARLVERFPALFGAIERGELHLTGLLMLGPHLTPENHLEVLARAKHRTKKEIAKLVRQLAPLPDVPARIDPLGPAVELSAAHNAAANPSWEDFVQSLAPVCELPPGDRPSDWMSDDPLTRDALEHLVPGNDTGAPAPARGAAVNTGDEPAPARGAAVNPDDEPAPARGAQLLAGPQRFKVQFTASEEYVSLVERAKALLSHSAPNASLEEIHLRALRALVTELEKRKYAVRASPKEPHGASPDQSTQAPDPAPSPHAGPPASTASDPRQRGHANASNSPASTAPDPRQRGCVDASNTDPRQRGRADAANSPAATAHGPRQLRIAEADGIQQNTLSALLTERIPIFQGTPYQ